MFREKAVTRRRQKSQDERGSRDERRQADLSFNGKRFGEQPKQLHGLEIANHVVRRQGIHGRRDRPGKLKVDGTALRLRNGPHPHVKPPGGQIP